MKVLIFGGTGEARDLAGRLSDHGHAVTTSLAGRTIAPLMPKGDVRIGGFGGIAALAGFLETERFDWTIDATHPFAARMSQQILVAAEQVKTPFLRLIRPGWQKPSNAQWIDVPDIPAAFTSVPRNAVVLVTSGHEGLTYCGQQKTSRFVVRLIEQPDIALPDNTELLIARPPYTFDGEVALMRDYGITHMIAKNAGGMQTQAKIDAAAALDIVTLMVRRPTLPAAREVSSVDQAFAVLQEGRP